MRLIGDDADLYKATLGTEMITGTLSAGEYLITAVAGTGSVFGGLGVGMVHLSRSGNEELAAGDACRPLENTKQVAAVTSWSIELTADEIEVTTLGDSIKKYRMGKSDASGTMRGQFETDAVKAGDGIQNRFFDVVIRKADGTTEVVPKDEGTLFIKGYLQKADTPEADKIFTYAEVETGAMKLGADLGAAQEFDGSFRLAGDMNLQLYYEEKA